MLSINPLARWLSNALGIFSFAEENALLPVLLHQRALDPFGYPRPEPNQKDVPLKTSFYFEVGMGKKNETAKVLPDSVRVWLEKEGAAPIEVLRPNQQFADGFSGYFSIYKGNRAGQVVAVYFESSQPLEPAAAYRVRVEARSEKGAELPADQNSWSFTTESSPSTHRLDCDIDLKTKPFRWHGGFFTGFCKPGFCTSASSTIPHYEKMKESNNRQPKCWEWQRDFWLTGMDHEGGSFAILPNIVRELETRRITRIEHREHEVVLHVEDFFGHEQYGIPSGRPVSEDYHPGDIVLIADGKNNTRGQVIAADDAAHTVTLARSYETKDRETGAPTLVAFATPAEGWKIDYLRELPKAENPAAPGLFPPGGCYLRKFSPAGMPRYYWGRLDKEFDVAHKQFGHRMHVNFVDAPGDLSVTGKNWSSAKDMIELRQVIYDITSHIIERYGDATLNWLFNIFNEPDLGKLFWQADAIELQRYYDYAVDAILRCFEDHGYDSDKVFIGGLELACVSANDMPMLWSFLKHNSPKPFPAPDVVSYNMVFADKRLDGKRSARVEKLCAANNGKGTPCDFISLHSYNRSEVMGRKMVRGKEIALAIDPEYYEKLWVCSHESCPDWMQPPDLSAADCYMGNGYFPSWCADVAWMQLEAAAKDPRYAYGETILTFWPWPNGAFGATNACTQYVKVDTDGNGQADRTDVVFMPINSFLETLTGMGPDFQVLAAQRMGNTHVAGFVARSPKQTHVLLYAHDHWDTQSRSDRTFEVDLSLAGLDGKKARIKTYRFDRENNTYYAMGRKIRDERPKPQVISEEEFQKINALTKLQCAIEVTVAPDAKGNLKLKVPLACNGVTVLVMD